MTVLSFSQVLTELIGSQKTVEQISELSTLGRGFMSFSTIQSRGHGHLQPDGLHVRISPTMSHVKSTKNFTSQKIWEILGNT